MTPQQQQYWDLGLLTMELIRAGFEGRTPDLPGEVDWDLLLRFCRFHSVGAMAAMGMEPCMDRLTQGQAQAWKQEKEKSIRRSILFEAERQRVGAYLTQLGCSHVFLKGSILQADYPRLGMRRMNDTDILIDSRFRENIRDWMVEQGYFVERYGTGNVDVYQKAPVYHFEIHTALYGGYRDADLADYYREREQRLLTEPGPSAQRQMNREDFYIYLMTHAHRHMTRRGIGIRNLVDLYVFRRSRGVPDKAYVRRELDRLGIREFAEACDVISQTVMTQQDTASLTDRQRELLLEFFTSGTFGTEAQILVRQVQDGSGKITGAKRARYLLRRLFPPREAMEADYPVLRRQPLLLPGVWAMRLLRGIFRTPGKLLRELKALIKVK